MNARRPAARRGHLLRMLGVTTGLVLMASMIPSVLAAPPEGGPPGNNGTVKIHEGPNEPSAEVRNQPHVCTFHLHFFFADPEQAGSWEIQEWAPGDKGTVVLTGTYDTAGDGEDRDPEAGVHTLPDGHYKLFWDGDTGKHDKHKVFWVDCDEDVQGEEETPPTGSRGGGGGGGGGGELPIGNVFGEFDATPPPTDVEQTTTTSAAVGGLQAVLALLGAMILLLSLIVPAPATRRATRR